MVMSIPQEVDTQTIMQMDADYVMHTVKRLPAVLVRGEGMRVWDADGREYLDFLAGIAVVGLGHSHPGLVDAISRQAGELMHVSNLFYTPQAPALAKRLTKLSGLGKAFFCNSGAEANEAAIKLARKWAKENRGEDKYEIITTLGSFHGRTLTTVTATGQPKYHKGFEPLTPGFVYVPYNDITALREAITDRTCAIMLEPVQGESGVWPATDAYMSALRRICDEQGILLILDEIQTGLGRTGKWFAHEHYDIEPDIMSLAKTLGGGFPVGACLATDRVAGAFQPGNHSSTFGANPLACAAALATLDIMEEEGLVENAAEMGAYLLDSLGRLKAETGKISEIRGRGLMAAVDLTEDIAPETASLCLKNGLIINPIGHRTLRFLPPLIVREEDIDKAVGILGDVIHDT